MTEQKENIKHLRQAAVYLPAGREASYIIEGAHAISATNSADTLGLVAKRVRSLRLIDNDILEVTTTDRKTFFITKLPLVYVER